MSINGDTHPPTVMPHTPSRPTASADKEPTPPSSETITSKRDSFLTTSDGDTVAPIHPFLAYARRVRSFSSPLKLNRARYLLTFVDAEVAQEWWKLMQEEFPDSVRESSQLFSFKSDRVPARAWDNPRFAHLKDKWTYRQLDDKENQNHTGDEPPTLKRVGKRGSLMRMLSTPSLGTIGEGPQAKGVMYNSPPRIEDDPFVVPTPPRTTENAIDVLELNRTLDRMQMMMNQTNMRIDALAERQQMYAESFDRLQQALESTMMQMQSWTTQYTAGGISTKNMRSAIETNASHVKTVLERQANDTDRMEKMHDRIGKMDDTVSKLDDRMEDGFRRLDGLAETQRVSLLEIQDTKSATKQTAERVQTMLERQHAGDEKLDAIMSSLDQTKRPPSSKSSTPTPSAGSIQRLQTAIEQQSTQLTGLISSQKASNKIVSKMQASIDRIPATDEATNKRIQDVQEARAKEEATSNQRIQDMQAAHAKEMKDLRREMRKLMDTRLEKMQTAQNEHYDRMVKALASRPSQVNHIVQCDHDVAPPPRKMNKELAGYWYKKA
ncbi:hypothetical protein C1H76_3361 [Elsinoe australis]|uniref:Uncharacterized protein n=1 Tax=Elsinoe australis TaxID=40998 RepID=A0A4U7B8E8_9PEZI|nr:hypothetical protein C1H76_3361 [Elsinoe australis]